MEMEHSMQLNSASVDGETADNKSKDDVPDVSEF